MTFDIYNTTVYQAVQTAKRFPLKALKIVNWCLLFFILILTQSLIGGASIFNLASNQAVGLICIGLSLLIFNWVWILFFKNALKENIFLKPSLKEAIEILGIDQINLARYLDFDLAFALIDALNFCKKKKKFPLSPIYIIFYLFKSEKVRRVFNKLGITRQEIKNLFNSIPQKETKILYDSTFQKVLKQAAHQAMENFHKQIEVRDFLVAAAELDSNFERFLFDKDLEAGDLDHVIAWDDFITYEADWKKKFWKLDNLLRKPGIGKHWAAGYTVNVDKYATDITELIKEKDIALHVIGRRREIEEIERILSRSKENNVLVIGKPGGGRSTIVYSFAKRVLEGRSLPVLNYRRVLELNMQALFSGLKTKGEVLERLNIVFSEAVNAGNIILIIDDIHNYIGHQESVGGIDLSSALIPYLSSPDLQIIGITTFEGFHKNIETNPAIMNFFDKIEIQEPPKEETMFILEDLLPKFEKRYGLQVEYKALKAIVELTDRFIQDVPFPEKAIDLLDEVMIYVKTKSDSNKVLARHVTEVISQKTKIPAGEIQKPEREKLLNLEDLLHRRIVNQEEAVNALADAMRRARAGVSETRRPIGTFLFLGPTGVGKTETCKALAESYFGSEKRMIRFDMSEFQTPSAINRLIGSPDGKEQGLLTNTIRERPFSLVLLDEIEKAHPNILNLFLQVLDEGRLTDALGRTVSFCNAIIVGTSNAGAEFIRRYVEEKKDYAYSFFQKELLEYLLREEIFRPEFINRFDAVLTFKPLTKEHLIKVAILMLERLNRRLNKTQGVQLIITKELAQRVVDLGYSPEFGARPMNRVIQDKIESQIAKKILQGKLKRGDVIEIKPEEI